MRTCEAPSLLFYSLCSPAPLRDLFVKHNFVCVSVQVALIVMSILPYELPLYVLLVMKRLALCSRRRLRSLIIPSLTVFFVARCARVMAENIITSLK